MLAHLRSVNLFSLILNDVVDGRLCAFIVPIYLLDDVSSAFYSLLSDPFQMDITAPCNVRTRPYLLFAIVIFFFSLKNLSIVWTFALATTMFQTKCVWLLGQNSYFVVVLFLCVRLPSLKPFKILFTSSIIQFNCFFFTRCFLFARPT